MCSISGLDPSSIPLCKCHGKEVIIIIIRAAVAQQVVHWSQGWQFDLQLLLSTCQGVLGQYTEPEVASDGSDQNLCWLEWNPKFVLALEESAA